MAKNDNEGKPTLERGSYGDRGALESNRPDGHGTPSEDAPILPSPERVTIPSGFPRKRK